MLGRPWWVCCCPAYKHGKSHDTKIYDAVKRKKIWKNSFCSDFFFLFQKKKRKKEWKLYGKITDPWMWQSSSLVSAELSALLKTWKLWDRLHDGTPLLLQIIWEKCTEPQTEGGREGLDGRGGGEGGARCHQREGSVWLWRKEPFFPPLPSSPQQAPTHLAISALHKNACAILYVQVNVPKNVSGLKEGHIF